MLFRAGVKTEDYTLTVTPVCECGGYPLFSEAWQESPNLAVIACECQACHTKFSVHLVGEKPRITAEQYLKQFSPEEHLRAFRAKVAPGQGELTDDDILGPDGWRHLPPAWMENYEKPGMVTLAKIREMGGFA